MNTFMMWPLSMAAQVLGRQLKSLEGDQAVVIASLRLVRCTMEDMEEPSGHWNGMIDSLAQQLAEMGPVTKKRKRGRIKAGQDS